MNDFHPYAHVKPGSVHVLAWEERRQRWICQVCGNLYRNTIDTRQSALTGVVTAAPALLQ